MRRLSGFLLIGLMVLGGVLWHQGVSQASAITWMQSPGGVLISLGLMILAALSAFPADLVALANGAVYGPVQGSLLTWLGAMLGAVLAYGLSSRWEIPMGTLQGRIQQAANDPLALLAIRLIPLFPFFLVNYGCGLARVPLRRFLWTTAVGILPLSIVLSAFGDVARTMPWLLLVAVLPGLLAGLGAALRRR